MSQRSEERVTEAVCYGSGPSSQREPALLPPTQGVFNFSLSQLYGSISIHRGLRSSKRFSHILISSRSSERWCQQLCHPQTFLDNPGKPTFLIPQILKSLPRIDIGHRPSLKLWEGEGERPFPARRSRLRVPDRSFVLIVALIRSDGCNASHTNHARSSSPRSSSKSPAISSGRERSVEESNRRNPDMREYPTCIDSHKV